MQRKVKYDIHIANKVLTAVAEGQTLRKIATKPGMPTTGTIWKWVRAYPEFAKAMNEADEWSARMFEEEGLDVSRAGMGTKDRAPDKDVTAATRALNEQLRWSAERRDPGKYGSTAKVNIKVPVQIITSLNLGQPGLPPKEETASIYDLSAESIVDVPFEEVPALPPPPPKVHTGPRKRVLVPRNPNWTPFSRATHQETVDDSEQTVPDGDETAVSEPQDEERASESGGEPEGRS